MKEMVLKNNTIGDWVCEITDVLNEYNLCKSRASKLYVYPYSNEYLLIRGVGATRGCIKFDTNKVITEIRIYDDYNYDSKCGVFELSQKENIQELMEKFIGYKLVLNP